MTPPLAEVKEKYLEMHGDVRLDPYYWLNDREDEEVLDYLERENDYHDKMTAHTKDFQADLFQEMKARIKEDDESVPYFYNGYYYITRYEKGSEYPIYSRKKDSLSAGEEIIFDVNDMAKDYAYYQLRGLNVSPDNKWVAFGVDTLSRRQYILHVKNLETGEILSESIQNTTGGSTWGNDNKTLFYTKKDPVTLRSDKIYRHIVGTSETEHVMIYHEEDETFNTYIYKTKSEKYLVIGSISTMTSEYRICDADQPLGNFNVFQPRERGLEYDIDHYKDHFYIVTNKDDATNFKLMKTPVDKTEKEYWEEVIAHRKDVLLEDVDLFKDYYVTPSLLSTLKTNNKALNVIGSIYAKENNLNNCLLINTNKHVVEALNGNIFLVKGSTIKTPPLGDGCLKGVMRTQLMNIIKALPEYELVEDSISPFELQQADELFITNVIVGIQPITNYRKKQFYQEVSKELLQKLNVKVRLS